MGAAGEWKGGSSNGQHPEKQQGKLEECMAEQIRECHGNVKGHPCMNKNKLSLA